MNPKTQPDRLEGIIQAVGGADMFVWLIMFILLLIGAGILYFTNREVE
ncbi:MAG: hypothetical protein JXK05_10315 [Campylobacterales bacterium]|nr:hypothetical protein [Campylobacterales bacterium]